MTMSDATSIIEGVSNLEDEPEKTEDVSKDLTIPSLKHEQEMESEEKSEKTFECNTKMKDGDGTRVGGLWGCSKKYSANAETEIFVAHFWSDRDETEAPPTVIESFSCAYWPKEGEGYISPLLHGRLFATSDTMYFVGWGGKKIVLSWKDVTSVSKETNMMGAIDNSLRVSFVTEDVQSSYFFGSFVSREDAFQLLETTQYGGSVTEKD